MKEYTEKSLGNSLISNQKEGNQVISGSAVNLSYGTGVAIGKLLDKVWGEGWKNYYNNPNSFNVDEEKVDIAGGLLSRFIEILPGGKSYLELAKKQSREQSKKQSELLSIEDLEILWEEFFYLEELSVDEKFEINDQLTLLRNTIELEEGAGRNNLRNLGGIKSFGKKFEKEANRIKNQAEAAAKKAAEQVEEEAKRIKEQAEEEAKRVEEKVKKEVNSLIEKELLQKINSSIENLNLSYDLEEFKPTLKDFASNLVKDTKLADLIRGLVSDEVREKPSYVFENRIPELEAKVIDKFFDLIKDKKNDDFASGIASAIEKSIINNNNIADVFTNFLSKELDKKITDTDLKNDLKEDVELIKNTVKNALQQNSGDIKKLLEESFKKENVIDGLYDVLKNIIGKQAYQEDFKKLLETLSGNINEELKSGELKEKLEKLEDEVTKVIGNRVQSLVIKGLITNMKPEIKKNIEKIIPKTKDNKDEEEKLIENISALGEELVNHVVKEQNFTAVIKKINILDILKNGIEYKKFIKNIEEDINLASLISPVLDWFNGDKNKEFQDKFYKTTFEAVKLYVGNNPMYHSLIKGFEALKGDENVIRDIKKEINPCLSQLLEALQKIEISDKISDTKIKNLSELTDQLSKNLVPELKNSLEKAKECVKEQSKSYLKNLFTPIGVGVSAILLLAACACCIKKHHNNTKLNSDDEQGAELIKANTPELNMEIVSNFPELIKVSSTEKIESPSPTKVSDTKNKKSQSSTFKNLTNKFSPLSHNKGIKME